MQYIVNKAEGGAKYTGTDAIGWSSLSIMHKEKMSGYIPVHMDFKKKHPHTPEKWVHVSWAETQNKTFVYY